MNLSRNMAILGFSMMTGLIVPKYFTDNPVNFGDDWKFINEILNILLKLHMFVGAVTACILDNTVGGATREQRGLRPRGHHFDGAFEDCTYSYPPAVMKVLSYIPFVQYMPCMPKEKKRKDKVAVAKDEPEV